MISLGCAKNLVDAEIMLGSVLAARHGDHRERRRGRRARGQHLRVHRFGEGGIDRRDPRCASAARAFAEAGPKADRQRLHVAAFFEGTARSNCRKSMRSSGSIRSRQLGAIVRASPRRRRLRRSECDPLDLVTRRPTYIPDYDTPRFRLTPSHSAYLKIAEGCNHPCSFCVIPQMRGRHRSRPPASVALGSSRAGRGRREGDQSDQPGHHLLRHGSVGGEGRTAPAGGFFTRSDARGACCGRFRKSGRILDALALHASRALER